MKKSICLSVTLSLLLSTLAACQTATPVVPAEPVVSPPAPSGSTVPSSPSSSLGSVTVTQSGAGPDYTIKTETPVMNGSSIPGVVAFNKAVSAAVQREVEAFKQDLPDAQTPQISTGSSFELTFLQVSPPGAVISLQLQIDKFIDGAAHPFDYTVAFNYDIANGQELSLDQLFVPGAGYLQTLSMYCQSELNKTDLASALFPEGLSPEPENYRSWNVSADGLVITFDASQVAAYVAGPQVVIVPYAVLEGMIDPQGPLAAFSR